MRLWLLFFAFSGGQALKFNNYFGDGMVLQRDVENKVWGYGILESNAGSLKCLMRDGKQTAESLQAYQVDEDNWEVVLPAREAYARCTVEISNEALVLHDVLIGDVWLCSGQSNMEQAMLNIENADEEIEISAAYEGHIRYTIVNNQLLMEKDDNFDLVMKAEWSRADQAGALQWMSAICFLYARTIFDVTGVPMGLISSDWGGTPIESWSNLETLDSCNIPDHEDTEHPSHTNSVLWNGMINPLKRTSIKGFLWYQGEANSNYNRDLYSCSFPAMIESWRKEFSENSATSSRAPFGFVQLSTVKANTMTNGFPVIRWHQTRDVGYVPNEFMSNVFMSSPLDTYDSADGYPGGIHPRYKQIAAERLAIASLNVTYGLSYPTRGPFPLKVDAVQEGLEILYDQDLDLREAEISGFYFCAEDPEKCDEGKMVDKWMEIKQAAVQTGPRSLSLNLSEFAEDIKGGSLAYLWRVTPVEKLLGLPIYAADEFQLPSPPWKFKL